MIIPSVITKQIDGSERQFDIYSRLLNENLVFLNGQVNDESAASIVAQIMHIAAEKKNAKISLYVNSPGGSVTAGLAIIDAMNLVPNKIETVVIGQACSMGAVILANGSPGCRIALENSRVMIHQPSGGVQGTAADIQTNFEEMNRLKDILYTILAKRSGQEFDKVAEDCLKDFFMSPDEALEYGLVDSVRKSD
ncbi:MAG: ATP-dependent Clp protease proteolytic subunit [Kordiimonadaceae bacterium]|nr:ATP-dependent Clp protease proteolytic subunit [Kordiimonadaceae bacterium]